MKKLSSFVIAVAMLFTLSTAALANITNSEVVELAAQNNINTFSVTYVENGISTTISSNNKESLVFEAGSIGKAIVAYICMQLIEEGMLSLDDHILQYLSDEWITDDVRFEAITIRQLLSHTAGFSPSFEMGIDRRIYFEPGNHFSYSGVGYIYLQQILETVTGETLEQLAQRYVFVPLNMQNSTFESTRTVTPFVYASSLVLYTVVAWSVIALVAFILGGIIGVITKFRFFSKKALFYICVTVGFLFTLVLLVIIGSVISRMILPLLLFGAIGFLILWFTRKSQKLYCAIFSGYIALCLVLGFVFPISLPVGTILFQSPNAAYSLKSTSVDIAIFANRLLSVYRDDTSVIRQMFDEQIAVNNNNRWGLGVAIEVVDGIATYWHSGINPGMQSLFVINPESDTVIIIMTNSDNGLAFATAIAHKIIGVNGVWEIVRSDLSQLE